VTAVTVGIKEKQLNSSANDINIKISNASRFVTIFSPDL